MKLEPTQLVLATGNPGKVRELTGLLSGMPFMTRSLGDFPAVLEVEETGTTFRANAELKASGVANQIRELCLADDSGLEVEALGGVPGVYSARFVSAAADYNVKIAKLLEMLDETGDPERRARFVCVMALADDDGRIIHVAEGTCNGKIADSPRGTGGFGYDPIFIPDGFGHTFGELGDDIKRQISHRAMACELIIRYLLDFSAV